MFDYPVRTTYDGKQQQQLFVVILDELAQYFMAGLPFFILHSSLCAIS